MNKKETDISLIQKYLNGELNARAMHQLEKRAQADPFLMDALEGYGYWGKDQRNQLDEISGRIKQRVHRKDARIIPWKFIAAAASVLLVLTVGGLRLLNERSAQKKTLAANVIKRVVKSTDTIRQQANFNQRNDIAALRAREQLKSQQKSTAPVTVADMEAKEIKVEKPIATGQNKSVLAANAPRMAAKSKDTAGADKDTTPLNEVVVMNYAAKKRADTNGAVSAIKAKSIEAAPTQSLDKALQGRVAGVTVTDDASITDAHPQPGWNSFDTYLKTKAISPDGKAGVVKISFQVDPKGVISDIKVIKGVSKATDQKAIDLINNGPTWVGDLNDLTKKIVLKITFAK